MNYCPGENFWLYINATDPLDQLKWLAETLQASETANEKVHIIGHIHPDDCLESWQENFYRVINRYESTVAGLFFGHSHVDEFKVLYDQEDKTRAYAVSYISGSVTTYSYLNPNYRIYTFDGVYENSSYQVLDHENIFLNLTEANLYNKPQWRKEYSAKVTKLSIA
jgi:sphingomyelin phosphodiesterase